MNSQVETRKSKNFWIYFSLLFVIALDAMCVCLVYPVFLLIFTPGTGGLFSAGESVVKADILFGVAMACFPIGALLGGPLLGDFSDQIGRKKVILMCLICKCIGLILFVVSIALKSVIMLFFVRFFTGFMVGTVGLAQASIVDISAPERKTVNLSFVFLAASVGFIIGPLFGGIFAKDIFIKYFGYMTPFYFASIICLLSFLMILIFFKETSTTRKESRLSLIKGVNNLLYGFMDRKFRKVSYILLLMQTALCVYFQTVTISIIQILHLTVDDLTYYMVALFSCCGITMLFLLRLVVKLFKIETVLFASMIILVFGFILGEFKSIVLIWIALLPIGIGVGLSYMALLTLFSNYSDKDAQGLAMGIASAISSAGWFIGPLLSGVLIAISYYMPYFVSIILIIIGIGFSARLVYKSKN